MCQKNKKKGQVIKTLTLKQKMKRHYMRQDDVSTNDKKQNNSSFLFSINKFLLFFHLHSECRRKALLRSYKNNLKERL